MSAAQRQLQSLPGPSCATSDEAACDGFTIEQLRASTANVLSIAQTTAALTDLGGEKLDERTVRRACEDGQLPSIRVGRRVLVPRLPLIALLEGPQSGVRA